MANKTLMWPGMEKIRIYWIMNNKLVKDTSSPPNTEQLYTKLKDILDLFPEKSRDEAERVLNKFSQDFEIKPNILLSNERYINLYSLLAFLVIFPKCHAFQYVKKILMSFLTNFGEGSCQGCGYVRRECMCHTLGATTFYDLPPSMQHSVALKCSKACQTSDLNLPQSNDEKPRNENKKERKLAKEETKEEPKKDRRKSMKPKKRPRLSESESKEDETISPKITPKKSPKKRKFPVVVFAQKKDVTSLSEKDEDDEEEEELIVPSESDFSEEELNETDKEIQKKTGHNLRPKKLKFTKNNFKVQIIAKEQERKRKQKEKQIKQKKRKPKREKLHVPDYNVHESIPSLLEANMRATAMSAGLAALAMAAEASQAMQFPFPTPLPVLPAPKAKGTDIENKDTEIDRILNDTKGIIFGHGIVDTINGKVGKAYILRDALTGGLVYKCMVYNCNVYLDTEDHATLHMRLHAAHGAKDMKCIEKDCNYTGSVNKWFDMLRHLKDVHLFNLTKVDTSCFLCGLDFADEKELDEHRDYHYYNKYRCFYCQVTCNTWVRMKAHSKLCNGDKLPCEKKDSRKDEISQTMDLLLDRVEEDLRKEGEMMDVGKREKIALMKSVSVEDKYCLGCPYCHLVFRERNLYSVHIDSHIDNGAFKCILCKDEDETKENKKVWSSWSELKKHYNKNHNTKPSFMCNVCKRKFNHKGNYRDHLRRSQHGQEEPLKCEICAKGFYSQHALKLHHEYEHGGQAKCLQCDYIADSKKQLRLHTTLKHTERKYACEECSKSFLYNHQLKLHMAKHKAQKKHKCRSCDGEFANATELRLHRLKSHRTGPAPRHLFNCESCNFSCTNKATLRLHNVEEHLGLDDEETNLLPIRVSDEEMIQPKEEIHKETVKKSLSKRKKRKSKSGGGLPDDFIPVTKEEKKQLSQAKTKEKVHKRILMESSARTRSYEENTFAKKSGMEAVVNQLQQQRETNDDSYDHSKFSGRRRSAVGNYRDMLSGRGLAREHSPPSGKKVEDYRSRRGRSSRSSFDQSELNDPFVNKVKSIRNQRGSGAGGAAGTRQKARGRTSAPMSTLPIISTPVSNEVPTPVFTPIAFPDHSYCNNESVSYMTRDDESFHEEPTDDVELRPKKAKSPRNRHKSNSFRTPSSLDSAGSLDEIIGDEQVLDPQVLASIPDKLDVHDAANSLLALTNDELYDIEQRSNDLDEIELNAADLELLRQNFIVNPNPNTNPVQTPADGGVVEEVGQVSVEQNDL